MKSNFRLFVFLPLFCLLPLKLNAGEDLSSPGSDVTISMDFQDANLKDVVKIFSIQSGLNFIASEAVQDRKITLFLDKVPIPEAMDKLFKANNLSYELDEVAKIFIVKDWGKPQPETVTKIFYLKYATVSSSSLKEEMSNQIAATATGSAAGGKWKAESDVGITQAVKKLLSSNGSVIEDYRTNSLIVTDIPNRMPVIEKLIASLDVPVPQIMLEVEMLDVSKNIVDKLGFKFGTDTATSPLSILAPDVFKRGARAFIGNIAYRGADAFSTAGVVSFGNLYAQVLDFLRTQTDTKYLARPRILTLSNETAQIKITTQETVGTITTTQGQGTASTTTTSAERKETGVDLRVTPQVNLETGEITMFIMPVVRDTVISTLTGITAKDPEERSTKSVVRIKDGDTVILGGLIRNEFTQTIKKVPILGDIPILGALFRHKGGDYDKNKERELLVFITPHIIKDTNAALVSAKKVKLPIREQGTGSAPERQMAVNTTLNSFEKIK